MRASTTPSYADSSKPPVTSKIEIFRCAVIGYWIFWQASVPSGGPLEPLDHCPEPHSYGRDGSDGTRCRESGVSVIPRLSETLRML